MDLSSRLVALLAAVRHLRHISQKQTDIGNGIRPPTSPIGPDNVKHSPHWRGTGNKFRKKREAIQGVRGPEKQGGPKAPPLPSLRVAVIMYVWRRGG